MRDVRGLISPGPAAHNSHSSLDAPGALGPGVLLSRPTHLPPKYVIVPKPPAAAAKPKRDSRPAEFWAALAKPKAVAKVAAEFLKPTAQPSPAPQPVPPSTKKKSTSSSRKTKPAAAAGPEISAAGAAHAASLLII